MCEFRIPFSEAAESLIARAQQEIQRAGGSFSGDTSNGTFRGKTPIGSISGAYQIVGQEIQFSIIKKPLLVSCSKIERELRGVIL